MVLLQSMSLAIVESELLEIIQIAENHPPVSIRITDSHQDSLTVLEDTPRIRVISPL